MSSAAPRGAAAAAGCVLLVVCVAWSGAPGGRAVLGTREARLQQLNLGGYDGSGDQSAFAPAGYGMDTLLILHAAHHGNLVRADNQR
jgi:hypothetical protein